MCSYPFGGEHVTALGGVGIQSRVRVGPDALVALETASG